MIAALQFKSHMFHIWEQQRRIAERTNPKVNRISVGNGWSEWMHQALLRLPEPVLRSGCVARNPKM
jgi:hypothetical protein